MSGISFNPSVNTQPENSINDQLPAEVLCAIFSFLDPKDLGNIATVCKQWREHASENIVWRRVCTREFPENYPFLPGVLLKDQFKLKDSLILRKYLPVREDEVTIKNRPIRTVGTSKPVKKIILEFARRTLAFQNQITFISHCPGNCGYALLAMEIFGEHASGNTRLEEHSFQETETYVKYASANIEHYAGILRAAVADYMLDHSDQFRIAMAKPSNEVNDMDADSLDKFLQEELIRYCNRVRNNQGNVQWCTGVELEAISAIIRTPIHIFHEKYPMRIGREGIEKGVIQPNCVIGGHYKNSPIRLGYKGDSYWILKLKT